MKKLILLIIMVLMVSVISVNVLAMVCCEWEEYVCRVVFFFWEDCNWEDVVPRSCEGTRSGFSNATCTLEWDCPEDSQYRGTVTAYGSPSGRERFIVYGEYQYCKNNPAEAVFCIRDESERRCCSATNDCVYSTKSTCFESGSAHNLVYGSEADAVCMDMGYYGEWVDCDADENGCSYCDAATDFSGCSGSGCFIAAGEPGVGEYDDQRGGNQCCGDDCGENVVTGFGYTVCCNNQNDCVDEGGVCRIGIEVCGNGVDDDCDGQIDEADCTSECECTPWVDDGCGCGGCADDQMRQIRSCTIPGCDAEGEERCVGSDECSCTAQGKFYRYKECAPGVCVTNTNDWACCDYADDCVFEGVCYLDADRAAWMLGNETQARCQSYTDDEECEEDRDCEWDRQTQTCGIKFVSGEIKKKCQSYTNRSDCGRDRDCEWDWQSGTCGVGRGEGNGGGMCMCNADILGSAYENQVFKEINLNLAGEEYCDPGTWWSEELEGASVITGTVYNLNGKATIEDAKVTALSRGDGILSYEDYTDELGIYSMAVVGNITYDISASKTDYLTQTKSIYVAEAETSVTNFNLRFNSKCDPDCTYVSDNLCHADCDNDPNGCDFYDSLAIEKCATPPNEKQPGFIVQYSSGFDIICCDGEPYISIPYKAVTKVNTTGNIVTIRKPVWYGGKLVNMVITFFE